jgi:hypothetical protein
VKSTIVRAFAVLLTAVVAVSLCQSPTSASLKKAKLIQWGGNTPPLTYIRDHVREMEKTPFDGMILNPSSNDGSKLICWNVWVPTPLKLEDYSKDIEALKATKFKKFTDNLLLIDSTPGRIDWFDDSFKFVVSNAGLMARTAKQCRMKGIMFDVEQYEGQLYDYNQQPEKDKRTFAEYQAKVRQRGQEFMKAINAEFPDVRIMMTFSYEVAYGSLPEGGDLSKMPYALLPSFIDGMLDVAGPKTIVYDGFEYSYGLKTDKEYKNAEAFMMVMGNWRTGNKDAFAKRYRSSFGVWSDNGSHWDSKDFSKNYFSPEELGIAVHSALKYSGGYVWLYAEKAKWWNWDGNMNVPPPYVDAIANARKAWPADKTDPKEQKPAGK